jgi:3-deoxy-D-manno-octulosonic-acid transferase
LDRAQPRLALILETELWPNLLRECVHRRIPVVIASARISPRTAGRYRRLRSLFSETLQSVTVAAQTPADADRFRFLGAPNAEPVGNIKFDIEISSELRRAGATARLQFGNRFAWVAGSTHAGEEEAALNAHRELRRERPDALLILVPRHPQRFAEVQALLFREGESFVTRSSGVGVTATISTVLVDTTGELLQWYAATDVAFVGGSLVPVGGHNVLEPAALGVPILCGPYMSNAQEIAERLLQVGGARQVTSAAQMSVALRELARDPKARRSMGERANEVVLANRGATRRVLDIVATHLQP